MPKRTLFYANGCTRSQEFDTLTKALKDISEVLKFELLPQQTITTTFIPERVVLEDNGRVLLTISFR